MSVNVETVWISTFFPVGYYRIIIFINQNHLLMSFQKFWDRYNISLMLELYIMSFYFDVSFILKPCYFILAQLCHQLKCLSSYLPTISSQRIEIRIRDFLLHSILS